MGIQTGVDGESSERLNGTLLDSFKALGTRIGAATTLVAADVLKLAVDAAADEARQRG